MTSTLQVVREEPVPFVRCPECSTRLDLPSLIGERVTVRSPADVAVQLQIEMATLEQEEIRVILLNTRNRVLAVQTVYRGNVSAAVVRVGELLREAIRLNASGLILVHNHPSGDPSPSPDDLHLTAEVLAAGRLIDVAVLDHIVVARDGWVSLRDRGVSFDRSTHSTQKES